MKTHDARMVAAQWRYEEGTDVNTPDEFYEDTSLHRMCFRGDTRAIQLLLQEGADVHARDMDNETPLHSLCVSGNTAAMRMLFNYGARANVVALHLITPLHICCEKGHLRAAKLLLQNGADVNAATSWGMTPLHMCRSANMAILLICFGANIARVDIDGQTLLHNLSPRHRIDVEAYAAEVERKRKEERERQRLYAMAVLERQRSPYFAVADIGSIMVRFL